MRVLWRGQWRRIPNYLGARRFPKLFGRGLFQPYHLDIEVTAHCNLKCTYCVVPLMGSGRPKNLTFEQFKALIEGQPYLVSVKLQGRGETFLNTSVYDMIEYLVQRHIMVFTYTNGTLLNEQSSRRLIASGMYAINFSLDGNKEVHNAVRIGSDYERIVASIRRLVELRAERPFPLIRIWCVVNRHNCRGLEELVDICGDLGVDKLTLQTHIYAWQFQAVRKDLEADRREQVIHIERARERGRALGLEVEVYSDYGTECLWPWTSAFVTCDGHVLPCCLIESPDLLEFGNVREQSFAAIWKSPEYREFRKRMKSGQYHEICAACPKTQKQ
jgi:radical SAM protein with 4Fe4S-binding SPASM domain